MTKFIVWLVNIDFWNLQAIQISKKMQTTKSKVIDFCCIFVICAVIKFCTFAYLWPEESDAYVLVSVCLSLG